ncbi:FAD-dependent oxidoreductase [Saccharopolyspora rosea]|uniref:NAD(P)/FAD-dependent oxidoreductase n=1 Tax=Saccharopolyspora rosea TaxID=524884 RepID=UPI0031E762E2
MVSAVDRIVVVGASLAGWSAANALRGEGFTGRLTLIGDEACEPYDRPPLSKAVLSGRLGADQLWLPRVDGDVEWLLGTAATGLDVRAREVVLADGRRVGFDRLLVATGTRARPWPNPAERGLAGVRVLRDRDDAARLRSALAARPRRVLVVGGGFTGSEVASSCRELGLDVTLVHRGPAPLSGAIGGAVGAVFADVQRDAGVDVRLGTTVAALDGDDVGRVRRARLSDGDVLDVDLVVAALGSVRNTEWLAGSGVAADERGVRCDAACRVLDPRGAVVDGVFAAGDVARWPHPLHDGGLVSLEHWGNAVEQGATAAHNAVHAETRAHTALPAFWSDQFGLNVKSVGLPSLADEVMITQGSPADREFVAAYGRGGRLVGALAVDSPRVLDGYAALIEARAPFPPVLNAPDAPGDPAPVDAGFPASRTR